MLILPVVEPKLPFRTFIRRHVLKTLNSLNVDSEEHEDAADEPVSPEPISNSTDWVAPSAGSSQPHTYAFLPAKPIPFPLQPSEADTALCVSSGSGSASASVPSLPSDILPPPPQPPPTLPVSTSALSASESHRPIAELALRQLRERLQTAETNLAAVTQERDASNAKAESALVTLQKLLRDSVVQGEEAKTVAAERNALRTSTDVLRKEAVSLGAAVDEAQSARARADDAESRAQARADRHFVELDAARKELARLRDELEDADRTASAQRSLLITAHTSAKELRARHRAAEERRAAAEEDRAAAEWQARQALGVLREERDRWHDAYQHARSGAGEKEDGEVLEHTVHPGAHPARRDSRYEALLGELARERRLRTEVEAREADGLRRQEDSERRARKAEVERQVLEAALDDVKRECREPFVVPALVDAIKDLARIQFECDPRAITNSMDMDCSA